VGSGFRSALFGFGVLWLAFSQLCLASGFCQLSVGFGFRSALVSVGSPLNWFSVSFGAFSDSFGRV